MFNKMKMGQMIGRIDFSKIECEQMFLIYSITICFYVFLNNYQLKSLIFETTGFDKISLMRFSKEF